MPDCLEKPHSRKFLCYLFVMENNKRKLKQIFDQNTYMAMATSSLSSEPWISILTFAYDDDFTLYWCSQTTSLHSKNIEENPYVAFTLFGLNASDADAFPVIYIKAKAQLVPEHALDDALQIYDQRIQKMSSSVTVHSDDIFTDFTMKMYMATPREFYTLRASSLHSQEWVDCRIRIKMDEK